MTETELADIEETRRHDADVKRLVEEIHKARAVLRDLYPEVPAHRQFDISRVLNDPKYPDPGP